MIAEHNPIWAPIAERKNAPLWTSAREVIAAYERAEKPARSQRYSLVLSEPLPPPSWRKP